MDHFSLASEQISVAIHSGNGETVSLCRIGDPLRTNWVAPESGWGRVDGFRVCDILWSENAVVATAEDDARNLNMTVEKRVNGEFYEEIYRIVNRGSLEFFLTRENFAFHYPFNCHLAPRPELLRDVCVSHIWCGGENSCGSCFGTNARTGESCRCSSCANGYGKRRTIESMSSVDERFFQKDRAECFARSARCTLGAKRVVCSGGLRGETRYFCAGGRALSPCACSAGAKGS